MGKPTVFFSHSSLDCDVILPIKDKISQITGNTLDLFMSSDGQSIPFGRNWIHKIEEGLKSAQIMFVFVTPNSIDSAWIYFEAGFAYSKDIQVIPVGIGINIGQLKPPLSLLQGFNITSADSLNNFITVINREFNLTFKDVFEEMDYKEVFRSVTVPALSLRINEIFTQAKYQIDSQCRNDEDNVTKCDVGKYFSSINDYLDEKEIPYAFDEDNFPNMKKVILVNGISIELLDTEQFASSGHPNHNQRLVIQLSTQNFVNSFNLLKELISQAGIDREWMYLKFYFSKEYNCLQDETAISSVVSENECVFKYLKDSIGGYNYNDKLNFVIRNETKQHPGKTPLYIITVSFKFVEVEANDICSLFDEMLRYRLIHAKS